MTTIHPLQARRNGLLAWWREGTPEGRRALIAAALGWMLDSFDVMQSLGRVRVFGQRSMGQALPALFTRLPNGDVLIHAYGDFVTADGTRLEGRGVVPDEPIALDRKDLLAGRDRTLEAALAWFDSLAASKTERNR